MIASYVVEGVKQRRSGRPHESGKVKFMSGYSIKSLSWFLLAASIAYCDSGSTSGLRHLGTPGSSPAQVAPKTTLSRSKSVEDFGAVCDGTVDDTVAIQRAFDEIAADRISVLSFPNGKNCALKSFSSHSTPETMYQLYLSNSSPDSNIEIRGNGATLLSVVAEDSKAKMTVAILFSGRVSRLTFDGLNIAGVHAKTGSDTTAIGTGFGSGVNIGLLTISNSTFRDLSRMLNLNGYRKARIFNNRFFLTDGRDSGSISLASPTVGIWVGSNFEAAPTNNTEVDSNEYNGCTSQQIRAQATNAFAGDGLVFGMSNGWNVHDNRIVNFSFEGIFLWARPSRPGGQPYPASQAFIVHNLIDASPVRGAGIGSYSIRCDESETVISDNALHNVIRGILVDGLDNPRPVTVRNDVIRNNLLEMLPNVALGSMRDKGTYGIKGLNVIGFMVENNQVTWAGGYVNPNVDKVHGIIIGPTSSEVSIRGNTVKSDRVTEGNLKLYAYWVQQVSHVTFERNIAANVDCGLFVGEGVHDVAVRQSIFKNAIKKTSGDLLALK